MLLHCIEQTWTQGKIGNLFEDEGVTLPIYCFYMSLLVMLNFYWFMKMIVKSFFGKANKKE